MEHFVARLEEIPEDGCHLVQLGELRVGVVRRRGEVFAYENRCLHQGGPICQGEVLGRLEEILSPDRRVVGQRFSEEELHLVCPWHGWEYDLTTGECVSDRTLRLRSFPVVVRDGGVYLVA